MSTDVQLPQEWSAAMSEMVHAQAVDHLLHHLRADVEQEDLCFALWRPSRGSTRMTALVAELVLPLPEERVLTGNVQLTSEYLTRAMACACAKGMGLALLHSHPTEGWQGMSHDDVVTERDRCAAAVLAATNLPLVGMTLATDETWSARFWVRRSRSTYERRDATNVRIVGQELKASYHPRLLPPPASRPELLRTVSTWGEEAQAHLARVHVGVIGLGSVGMLVSEQLARMGVRRVTLLDFDHVERHNLDRLLGAHALDAEEARLKVFIAKQQYVQSATAESPTVKVAPFSLTTDVGYDTALDCDCILCCVDRHWPRRVLNHLAYAHLIPVVEGGVIVRMREGRCKGLDWSARTVAPSRPCLACTKGFDPGLVQIERDGTLDDPGYLKGLEDDHPLRRNENVFAFCMAVASLQVMQLIALTTGLLGRPNLGVQAYHHNIGQMLFETKECSAECESPALIASGEAKYSRSMLVEAD